MRVRSWWPRDMEMRSASLAHSDPVTASFIYSSGHCRRWRSHIQVKIVAGSLFVHCEIAYFNSVTTEQWLVASLKNLVTMGTIACEIFCWIRKMKLKDTPHGILRFYKGFCKPKRFACTSNTDPDEHVVTQARKKNPQFSNFTKNVWLLTK